MKVNFAMLPLQDPSNSSAKSVDAASRNTVQSSHPFRVIDNDGLSIHSMQSLGRVGRILSGSLDPAAMNTNKDSQPTQRESQSSQQSESPTAAIADSPSSQELQVSSGQKAEDSQSQSSNYSLTMNPHTILQEPDVIASTKLAHSKTTDSVSKASDPTKSTSDDSFNFRSHQRALEFLYVRHVASATRRRAGRLQLRPTTSQSSARRS